MTVHGLHYMNGAPPTVVNCSYCGASLEDDRERAAASFPSGTKFFCKAPEGHVEDSCYLKFRRRYS